MGIDPGDELPVIEFKLKNTVSLDASY
jgi:hypothetical protein